MRILWNLYYLFYTPKTKSENIIKFSRITGIKINNIKLGNVNPEDFK